jgi:aquaporin Z
VQRYVAELTGTFVLLFGVVAAIASQANWPGIVLVNAIIIAAMIAALGPISGAHFNPAVTLGMLVTGRMSLTDALSYWIAQLLGAVIGLGVLEVAVGKERMAAVLFGVPKLTEGLSAVAGLGI